MKKLEFSLRKGINMFQYNLKKTTCLKFKNSLFNFKFSSVTDGNKLMKVIFPKPSETIDDGEILSLEKSKLILFLRSRRFC